jgi:hypothetical protein
MYNLSVKHIKIELQAVKSIFNCVKLIYIERTYRASAP